MWKRIVKWVLTNDQVIELVVAFFESLQDGELSTEERESLANQFIDFVAEQIKELL